MSDKPKFTEKVFSLFVVAVATVGGIFVSMQMVTGALGVCK
jgi:hypothetical protein